MRSIPKSSEFGSSSNKGEREGAVTQRIKSGIDGLDEVLCGGIPFGSQVLVAGEPGSGKTTFGMQFLYKGASMYNEPGVYVTFEEPPHAVFQNMAQFKWDLGRIMGEDKLRFIDASISYPLNLSKQVPTRVKPFDLSEYLMEDFYGDLETAVKEIGAKRIVIDPITVIGLHFRDPIEARREFFGLSRLLTQLGVTSILTSEISRGAQVLGRFGVEEFISTGVIILRMVERGTRRLRTIEISKMRGTAHYIDMMPLEIDTGRGIALSHNKLK
ncbi:MAG: ATPase domain-containing protein [Candidatus Atabeyarchaeum deiterrae]